LGFPVYLAKNIKLILYQTWAWSLNIWCTPEFCNGGYRCSSYLSWSLMAENFRM